MWSLTEYPIQRQELFEQAMTHRSAGAQHYERLEFLGDAVLQFLITEILYHRFSEAQEGELTKKRSAVVRGETLADIAAQSDLEKHIRWGVREQGAPEEFRRRILGRALESWIGALFLDQGLAGVRVFVERVFEPWISGELKGLRDLKSELQEWVQKHCAQTPVYELIHRTGEAHDPTFTVKLTWAGGKEYIGHGKSRKKAEELAAQMALEELEQMNE